MSILEFIPLLNTIISILQKRAEYKAVFTKQRFTEPDGKWRIRLIHPNKPIPKCRVYVDDKPLISSKNGDDFEHTIEEGGGDNFIIQNNITDQSKVEIKSDGKTIWKGKFSDIELSKP